MYIESDKMLLIAYSINEEDRRSQLKKIAVFFMDLFKSGNIEELEYFLNNFDPSKALMIVSTAVLRFTFAYSGKLDNWKPLLNRLIEHCKVNNVVKWESYLRGLLDEKSVNPVASEYDKLIGIHPKLQR